MTELVRWRFRVWYLQKSISNRLQHFLNIANFAIVFARIVMSESRKCCGAMSLKILKGQGGQESAMLYQSFPLVLRKSGHLWQDPDLPRPTHCLFHPETEARVPTQQIGGSAWIPRWICEKIHWNIALVVSKIYWMCLFSWKWVLILDLHILDGSSSNLTMVFWLKKGEYSEISMQKVGNDSLYYRILELGDLRTTPFTDVFPILFTSLFNCWDFDQHFLKEISKH